jgi:hypothetical protein
LSISASGDYLSLAQAKLKDTGSWEWSYKSSNSKSTGSTQSASVTVGGPAYGYTGPTVMRVYVDTIYHTFAFAVEPVEMKEIGVKGVVAGSDGKPLPFSEVTLQKDGAEYRTFTKERGEYAFFGKIDGPAIVQAAGVKQVLGQTSPARTLDLR